MNTIKELREQLADCRWRQQRIGFVPTMGFLHAGHASLLRTAREQCECVVLSIFVNPLQFGENEDFDRYPRDSERDLAVAVEAGADIVFMPQQHEMYPRPMKTKVTVAGISDVLCGASRPGHFDGVATVVMKLFHIVQPNKAFFGLKDAQQVAVIAQMAQDMNLPLEIVPCPIVREADGLAMSSRNVYLNPEQRKQAVILSETLAKAEDWLQQARADETTPQALRERLAQQIATAPLASIDYVEILRFPSFQPVQNWQDHEAEEQLIVALAVKFGQTRLIDNRIIPFP
jgi:pantoate--beta-alanine ligase